MDLVSFHLWLSGINAGSQLGASATAVVRARAGCRSHPFIERPGRYGGTLQTRW
jgi:hypothetical protein